MKLRSMLEKYDELEKIKHASPLETAAKMCKTSPAVISKAFKRRAAIEHEAGKYDAARVLGQTYKQHKPLIVNAMALFDFCLSYMCFYLYFIYLLRK